MLETPPTDYEASPEYIVGLWRNIPIEQMSLIEFIGMWNKAGWYVPERFPIHPHPDGSGLICSFKKIEGYIHSSQYPWALK